MGSTKRSPIVWMQLAKRAVPFRIGSRHALNEVESSYTPLIGCWAYALRLHRVLNAKNFYI